MPHPMPLLRAIAQLLIAFMIAGPARAQGGWSVTNIPDAGRYDDISFVSELLGWAAGGPSGWIYRTTDGGESWTLQFNSPYYLRSIEFVDANTGFAGALNGKLYRTLNGGQDWSDITSSIAQPPPGICGLAAADANTIYGCGIWSGPAFIIKSTNGGDTWDYIDMSAYATRLVDVLFLTPEVGFATGTANPPSAGGVILHTTDGGASWTAVCSTLALSDIVWKIQRLDDQRYYASIYSEPVNDDTRMLRSADGGMSWELITISDDYTYVEAVGFMDADHGWVGGDEVLWETDDGGDSWQATTFGSSHNRFLRVSETTGYLSGARVYKYQAENSTRIPEPLDRTEYHNLVVAPNPAGGPFIVRLTIGRATIAELKVLSARGEAVVELVRGVIAAGEYSYPVDPTGIASETCFVVLRTNEGMRHQKVTLLREP